MCRTKCMYILDEEKSNVHAHESVTGTCEHKLGHAAECICPLPDEQEMIQSVNMQQQPVLISIHTSTHENTVCRKCHEASLPSFWLAPRVCALLNALRPAAPYIILPLDHLMKANGDISWCEIIIGRVPL